MTRPPDDLLWGGPAETRRPARPRLTRDRVVEAAVRLADVEGLPALSMQRVAEDLGAATMSLYRHVPGKAELVMLMFERAVGPAPDLAGRRGDWRAALADWARANRDVFARHPWTLPLATSPRAMGPNEAAWTEAALRALAPSGLPPAARLDVLLLVNGYVRGSAVDLDGGPTPPSAQALAAHGPDGRYAELAAALAEAEIEAEAAGGTPGAAFEFGLARVLDGVQLYIRGAVGGSGRPG
ncbi:MAG TPA: TetR/AcrR family transcriptional regulator [Pseudonocardia sp.]|jgi:AcrR family transcriptional regulator